MFDPRLLQSRSDSRSAVLRRAIILTPSALVLLAMLSISVTYLPQSWFPVLLLGLATAAAAIEAIAALRDLRAQPTSTRGVVQRLWKKSRFLFFGRIDYMIVNRRLFEVDAIAATELREGEEVVIEHWPHTNVIISLARPPAATP